MTVDQQLVRTFRRDTTRRWHVEADLVRDNGDPVFDPNTGTYTDPETTIYSGPVGLRPQGTEARIVEYGGQAVTLRTYDVELPADTDVRRGDELTVTASPLDADLVGRTLTVIDVLYDDRQVVRRAVVQDNITEG